MQGQRETNASNTSLIDDIYDDIMLNEEKRKKTYNIKDYSIKVVEEKEEEEQPKEHGIFKNIFSKQENQYKSNGPVLEVDGKKVYTKSEQEKEKQRRSDRYYYTKERQKARRKNNNDTKLSHRTLMACFMILVVIPLIIYLGITLGHDRKYYIVSLGIIVCTMLPFFMVFEDRKPQARELIIIAVLSAIGVAGRAAFFMLPQFKPVVAIVIISAVCFGAEAGFLVGAMTGFVSNFFFAQGPWTPWQMFSFGIIGFIAGILFKKGKLQKRKISLCIYGGLSTFFIYGFLLDTATWLIFPYSNMTLEGIIPIYLSGIPFNIVHAIATVFFLAVISKPMIEKLDRIKEKYGLIEP